MMKNLSISQLEALSAVYDTGRNSLPDGDCVGMRRSLNWLYGHDYLKIVTYANGDFWEMTDKGLDKVNEILKERNLI